MGKSGTVSAKQTVAIAALLDSRGVKEAADKSGVPVRTLYKWIADDPAFKTALASAEGELLDAAMRRLLQLQDKALNALERVLDAPDTPPGVLATASVKVIDAMLKVREQRTVEERLTALEMAAAMEDV